MPPLIIPALARTFLAAAALSDTMPCRHVAVLAIVGHNPDCSAADIADACAVPRPSVSTAAAKLESLGFLRRGPHAGDRRRIRLSLTAAGRSALSRVEG